MFQSLGRDSVGFSISMLMIRLWQIRFQSLGRDSVGFSGPVLDEAALADVIVSIPRSGFCGV